MAWELLVVEESLLLMELMAFFVDSFLAYVIDFAYVELGFDASGCFDNLDFDFFNFGYMVFFLRIFSFVCLHGSFMHESIHLSR